MTWMSCGQPCLLCALRATGRLRLKIEKQLAKRNYKSKKIRRQVVMRKLYKIQAKGKK
jgi:hypothetical protein